MIALVVSLVARAERIDVAGIDAMIASVKPEVESYTGLTLSRVPKAHISTYEALVVRVGNARADQVRWYRPLEEGEGGRIRAAAEREVRPALALYMHDDGDIYLNRDAVRQAFADLDASTTLFRPVLRCVIAHELTHALQDQVAAMIWDPAEPERSMYLREGQAMQVEHALCTDERARTFAEAITNVDILASRAPDELTVPYGFARLFMEAVEREGGRAAAWGALQVQPPPDDAIVAVARDQLVQGWNDAGVLNEILAPFRHGDGWTVTGAAISPIQFLPMLEKRRIGQVDADAPPTIAGLSSVGDRGDHRAAGFVFLLENEDDAEVWVGMRRTDFKRFMNGGTIQTFATSDIVSDDPRAFGLGKLDDAAGVSVGPYREAWARRGRVVAGVAFAGTPPSRRALATTLLAIFDRFPDSDPPASLSPAARAIVDRTIADGAALGADLGWQGQYNRALYRSWVADFRGCIDTLRDTPASPIGNTRTAELAIGCALGVQDERVAERWVEAAGGTDALKPLTMLQYAELLAYANRMAEVEPLLPVLKNAGIEPSALAFLDLVIALRTARWDRVETLVALPAIEPSARAWAASEMAKAGRNDQARALFESTCPLLEGNLLAQCEDAIRQLPP